MKLKNMGKKTMMHVEMNNTKSNKKKFEYSEACTLDALFLFAQCTVYTMYLPAFV